MNTNNELLKISEVAKMLNVARTTAYNYVNQGILPIVRFPTGTLRVRRSDIEALSSIPANEAQESNTR